MPNQKQENKNDVFPLLLSRPGEPEVKALRIEVVENEISGPRQEVIVVSNGQEVTLANLGRFSGSLNHLDPEALKQIIDMLDEP